MWPLNLFSVSSRSFNHCLLINLLGYCHYLLVIFFHIHCSLTITCDENYSLLLINRTRWILSVGVMVLVNPMQTSIDLAQRGHRMFTFSSIGFVSAVLVACSVFLFDLFNQHIHCDEFCAKLFRLVLELPHMFWFTPNTCLNCNQFSGCGKWTKLFLVVTDVCQPSSIGHLTCSLFTSLAVANL